MERNYTFEGYPEWYNGVFFGNGDLGAVVFGERELTFGVGKNDFWDRRNNTFMRQNMPFFTFYDKLLNEFPVDPESGYIQPDYSYFSYPEGVRQQNPNPKPLYRVELSVAGGSGVRHTSRMGEGMLETAIALEDGGVCRVTSFALKDTNVILIRVKSPNEVSARFYRLPDSLPDGGIAPPELFFDQVFASRCAGIRQVLPGERTYPDGFEAVSLCEAFSGGQSLFPQQEDAAFVYRAKELTLCIASATTRDACRAGALPLAKALLSDALAASYERLLERQKELWGLYWQSYVTLDDPLCQRMWDTYNYMLGCCVRPGAISPGLFTPFIVTDTSGWNGSYVTDYNLQQIYMGALSSNHPELMQPYIDMLASMDSAARKNAEYFFDCPDGYALPHDMFPIDMQMQSTPNLFYPLETLWLASLLWDVYEYTLDLTFLRTRAFPILAGVTRYLLRFVREDESGLYLYPTRSCEHHGFQQGLPFNRNGAPELAFGRVVLRAAVTAAELLGCESEESARWAGVLARLPDFPRSRNQLGEIFIDSEVRDQVRHSLPPPKIYESIRPSKHQGNDGPWMYYNCPTSLFQVYPACLVDADSSPGLYRTAVNTLQSVKFEGPNDLVMRQAMSARLGLDTFDGFLEEIRKRLKKNGTLSCRVNRLSEEFVYDKGYFDFDSYGFLTEFCGITAAINEMLLCCRNGVICLFQGLGPYRRAEFHRLRARGALLVSAAVDRGFTLYAEITAEQDARVSLRLPWPAGIEQLAEDGEEKPYKIVGDNIVFELHAGKTCRVTPRNLDIAETRKEARINE